jgi:hypothetical protein
VAEEEPKPEPAVGVAERPAEEVSEDADGADERTDADRDGADGGVPEGRSTLSEARRRRRMRFPPR